MTGSLYLSNKLHWLRLLILVMAGLLPVVCGAGCTKPDSSAPPSPSSKPHLALWVWNAGVAVNEKSKAQFLDFAQGEGIETIYLYAYDLLPHNPAALKTFISQAGAADVEILIGDSAYALAENHAQVLDFVEGVIAFTQEAQPAEKPAGLHLDIEPYILPEWEVDQAGVATQYLDLLTAIRQQLASSGDIIRLSADIPFWYDTIEIQYEGETKLLHQHVQDIVDIVVLMDYRDTAAGDDGIITHAQNELTYAGLISKSVTIGVETNCIEPAKITFCEEGQAVLKQELAAVEKAMTTHPGFQGFAIHDYTGYEKLSRISASATGPVIHTTTTKLSAATSCPPVNADGTVSPAVAIASMTFVVNGIEQVVSDYASLVAPPGSEVGLKEVLICADPFTGAGGNVYIEVDPVQSGQVIPVEVKGTRSVRIEEGLSAIPGPSDTWTVGDGWSHFSVVSVHYPAGGNTQNPNCESGACEIDDRIIVPFR